MATLRSSTQAMDRFVMFVSGAGAGVVIYHLLSRRSRRRRDAGKPRDHAKLRAFEEKPYPIDHWSRVPLAPTAERFIAVFKVYDDVGGSRDVLVLLKSAEGYATVVSLVDRAHPIEGLNNLPTQRDYEAVTLAASQVAAAFLRLGIFPALELLGNNSHSFDVARDAMVLGNAHEPFFPHIHVIGRGDPQHAYIGDVPLRGLPPGEVMVPRQRTQKFASADEAGIVAHGIGSSLDAIELHPQVRLVERRSSIAH